MIPITDEYRQRLATLPPIDPNSLTITLGPVDGYDPINPTCCRCGGWSGEEETAFGVAIAGQPGRVCPACLESAGEDSFPAALAGLVQGLDGVSNALCSVPADEGRVDLYRIAREALEWLDDSGQEP